MPKTWFASSITVAVTRLFDRRYFLADKAGFVRECGTDAAMTYGDSWGERFDVIVDGVGLTFIRAGRACSIIAGIRQKICSGDCRHMRTSVISSSHQQMKKVLSAG